MKKGLLGLVLLCGASSFAGAFVDSELDIIFPKELGGMEFDQAVKYDAESFGYSISYKHGEFFTASVTICDLGLESIPDGYKGEGVNLVFKGVESERKLRVQNFEISKPRKRGAVVVPQKGATRFSNLVFQHMEPRVVADATRSVPRIQSVYVTAIHDRLVKLDFAFDVADGTQARAMSEQMVSQLITMLQSRPSEQELLLAACDALLLDPSGYGGRTAGKIVLAKAETMGDLVVYPKLFAWPTSYYNRPRKSELLTASYFAGMLQVVVPQQLTSGGEFEGFIAMLSAYDVMRAKGEIVSINRLDEWGAVADKKVLFDQLMVEFSYRLR